MNQSVRYRNFSAYLKERFGSPTRKLSLNAGFSCPNRDGKLSDQGCVFCEPSAFSPFGGPQAPPLIKQLRQGIEQGKSRGIQNFIAYFQAYTNTYAPVAMLKDIYDTIWAFPEIKGLAIGTRPDCVDQEILDLIAGYAEKYEVWMEYGMQSIHDETLARINRGHGNEAFLKAVNITREYPELKICAHVILGLPGESEALEKETAETVASLRLEGIKLHPLHVVTNTSLAQEYYQGRYQPLARDEYVNRVVRFLECLWPETIIQRLTAECPEQMLVAPDWLRDKSAVLREIQDRLEREDTWQGRYMKL
ncbi:TIGR01212 family radical SAM protein [bacterium]|nr:TIGR01212 family radical SAM protein [bacterium]